MNQRPVRGWIKHIDFIVLDMVCLQLAFLLAHSVLISGGNPYLNSYYRYLIVILTLAQMLTIILTDNYTGITRRGYLEDLYSILRFAATTFRPAAHVRLPYDLYRLAPSDRLDDGRLCGD